MNDKRLDSAEFTQFFEDVLQPEVDHVEQLRKKTMNQLISLMGGGAFVCLVAAFVGSIVSIISVLVIVPFIAVLTFFACRQVVFIPNQNEANRHYRKHVYTQAFRFFYPTSFSAAKKFPIKIYDHSLFFNDKVEFDEGEYFLEVKVGDFTVEIQKTKLLTAPDDAQPIHKGVFGRIKLNKNFAERTVVHSRKKVNSNRLRTVNFNPLFTKNSVVDLESAEFMKNFVVLSTSQIDSRFLLSPSTMERIIDFQRKFPTGISLSFVEKNIFLKIPLWENLFDINLISKENREKTIKHHLSYFLAITDIVEDLNLNNQIWNK